MRKNLLRLSALNLLMMSSVTAMALPFSTFDPRSMAMGSTGVAVDEPSTAPFFNPAMLAASVPSKKFSFEFVNLGMRLIDPGNMHSVGTSLTDSGTGLTTAGSAMVTNSASLATSAATLTTNISALTTSIASFTAVTVVDVPTAIAAASSLSGVSTSLSTVSTNMTSVSTNMTAVSTNANSASTNLTAVNQQLLSLNNQPLQGEFGAATVIAIPSKEWGLAIYANAWGAMGGSLQYNDSATVTTVTAALSSAATALASSGTATGSSATAITTATTSINAAVAACTQAAITAAGSSTTCTNNLTTANTNLTAAQTSLSSTSTTLSTNGTTVTNASNSVNTNTTLQSTIHIRGLAVSEAGLSIAHRAVTYDQEWAWGITPKIMQIRMYDATMGATGSLSNATGNDYLAYYSTLNVDVGLAKILMTGWRTGIVVKNLIPQTFDFKNAPTAGATPVANGSKLTMNPQVRVGTSYANDWMAVALDADLTRNDPAGLEDPSQFIALGLEFSASGWTQIRAGYRADMVNAARNIASFGMGMSPRLPFFKPHFDFALTVSPDAFTNGLNAATQVGAALKLGFNF